MRTDQPAARRRARTVPPRRRRTRAGRRDPRYLDASIDERDAGRLSREDATRAARAEMGSMAAVKDHTRDVGWEAGLDSLWRDFRYCRPDPAQVAGLLHRRHPHPRAGHRRQLGDLQHRQRRDAAAAAGAAPRGSDLAHDRLPEHERADLLVRGIPAVRRRHRDRSAASSRRRRSRRDALVLDGMPEPVDCKWVSGNYFTTLEVPAGDRGARSCRPTTGCRRVSRVAVLESRLLDAPVRERPFGRWPHVSAARAAVHHRRRRSDGASSGRPAVKPPTCGCR